MADYRISRLLSLAKESLNKNSPMSGMGKRYVRIAEEISSHYKVGIPKTLKVQVCRKCHSPLVPGVNAVVRAVSSGGYVAYKCECGAERHIFYK